MLMACIGQDITGRRATPPAIISPTTPEPQPATASPMPTSQGLTPRTTLSPEPAISPPPGLSRPQTLSEVFTEADLLEGCQPEGVCYEAGAREMPIPLLPKGGRDCLAWRVACPFPLRPFLPSSHPFVRLC